MREFADKELPLGLAGFSAIRSANAIYVDKTALVYGLCSSAARVFLARPRRFGKSVLVTTFESLFRYGLKEFKGLAIEKLWTDRTYDVVRLDFSMAKSFTTFEEFRVLFDMHVLSQFGPLGFAYEEGSPIDVIGQLAVWLQSRKPISLVVLIDEYDSPLTEKLMDEELFLRVQYYMSRFFLGLKSNDTCLRYFFMTGVTKLAGTGVFSAFNNLNDISLDSDYGAVAGYTEEEIEDSFAPYLAAAEEALGKERADLLRELRENYDGYTFDRRTLTHVYCPWSVLKFLSRPHEGFRNYWFSNGGQPRVLLNYLRHRALTRAEEFDKEAEVSLGDLEAVMPYGEINPSVLLLQTGYLTLEDVDAQGRVTFKYPNREVEKSLKDLFSTWLWRRRSLPEIGGKSVGAVLAQGSDSEVVSVIDWAINTFDYNEFPLEKEAHFRAAVQVLFLCASLDARIENHSARGRSDLEVSAGGRRWVFEFKVTNREEQIGELLDRAADQIRARRYGETLPESEVHRLALVCSLSDRAVVAWRSVPVEKRLPS